MNNFTNNNTDFNNEKENNIVVLISVILFTVLIFVCPIFACNYVCNCECLQCIICKRTKKVKIPKIKIIQLYEIVVTQSSERKNDCVICYQVYGNNKTAILKCGHKFHKKCVKKWLDVSAHKDCPLCRK